MASQRRPGQHRKPKPRTAVRTAATVVTAAATMTGVMTFAGTASADPAQSFQQTKERVNQLHSDVIKATEAANGVEEQIEKQQGNANQTQARITEEQAVLNALRDQIGVLAANQYRSGGLPPSLSLALSGDPEGFLQKSQMMSQLDGRQAAKLKQIAAQARVLQQDRTEASSQLAELEKLRTELNKNKTDIQTKLAEAQRLLNTLDKKQQDDILNSDKHASGPGSRDDTDRSSRAKPDTPPPANDVPVSGRAAAAVAFAKAQIGKPYVPRGVGPDSYDCSGLTMASWKAANVKLTRTTLTQVNDGPRISKGALKPGDLVFYYPDNSHVGIFIGNGQIVHAPRPGKNVTIAPVDSMPFYAAVRPG
ncbi:NlpC/P60 family protein [Embleya sp. NBC_00896]|uniref:C40 family peptidase n=1 Tax=Embleya sp. NBC_00896 TaxID=2975961 RepID=UPI002F90D892|nr:NlpC/P60 family protein [Embleya sp. NBC_00896]